MLPAVIAPTYTDLLRDLEPVLRPKLVILAGQADEPARPESVVSRPDLRVVPAARAAG